MTWGEPYGRGPHFILPDGTFVTMHRKVQKVRFFDKIGRQVGPEQSNVAPAMAAAYRAGWKTANPKLRSAEALARVQEPWLFGKGSKRRKKRTKKVQQEKTRLAEQVARYTAGPAADELVEQAFVAICMYSDLEE